MYTASITPLVLSSYMTSKAALFMESHGSHCDCWPHTQHHEEPGALDILSNIPLHSKYLEEGHIIVSVQYQ